MSDGRFVTFGSPYTYDHRQAEFYRRQDAERAEREHVERSARWIASKLAGHQYDAPQAMVRSVVELVTTIQGGEPDDEMVGTITKACTMLWAGQVDRDAMYRKCVERSETGVRFTTAA